LLAKSRASQIAKSAKSERSADEDARQRMQMEKKGNKEEKRGKDGTLPNVLAKVRLSPSSERNSGEQKPRREIKQPRNPINRSVDIVGNKNSPVTDYLIKNGTASLAQPSSSPLPRSQSAHGYAQMQTELGFNENTCDSASRAYSAFQSLVKSQLSSYGSAVEPQ